jgi:copper(I)-binding protein
MRTRGLVVGTLALVALSCSAPAGTPDIDVGPAQASRPIAGTSQVVLTITNRGDGDDALVGVDTTNALGIESHLTEIVDGRVTMRELDEVPLPAGSTTRFQPGGLHLMLIVPDETVVVGATFDVTLRFARSPARTVSVTVVELLDLVEDDGS